MFMMQSSHKSSAHSFNILTYCFTYRNRDWTEESFFCTRRGREKKRRKISTLCISFSLSLSWCLSVLLVFFSFLIDNKNEEGEKEKAFCNIFYLLFLLCHHCLHIFINLYIASLSLRRTSKGLLCSSIW